MMTVGSQYRKVRVVYTPHGDVWLSKSANDYLDAHGTSAFDIKRIEAMADAVAEESCLEGKLIPELDYPPEPLTCAQCQHLTEADSYGYKKSLEVQITDAQRVLEVLQKGYQHLTGRNYIPLL